jgi:hypothetical protein
MATQRLTPILATPRFDGQVRAFRFSPYKRPVKQPFRPKRLSKPRPCSEGEPLHSRPHRSIINEDFQASGCRLFHGDFKYSDPESPLPDIQGPRTKTRPFYFLPDNSTVNKTRKVPFSATKKSHPANNEEPLLSLSRNIDCQKYPSTPFEGEPFFISFYNLNRVNMFLTFPRLFSRIASQRLLEISYTSASRDLSKRAI